MNVKEAIRVSAIETLRAMVFTESWALSDIAYRKGVYEPDEYYLDSLCYDVTELEDLNYLIVHGYDYDIFSNHYFFVSYNLIKCEQLLGITCNMFFERGVCYENIDCPKFSVQGYKVSYDRLEFNITFNMFFIKRGMSWYYLLEFHTEESTNPSTISWIKGIVREATRDEIAEVASKGVRMW